MDSARHGSVFDQVHHLQGFDLVVSLMLVLEQPAIETAVLSVHARGSQSRCILFDAVHGWGGTDESCQMCAIQRRVVRIGKLYHSR